MLYIVPTPIGNLEDITLRAIRILNEADLILAEDTRKTGILLKHLKIIKRMLAYHQYNEHQFTSQIIQRLKNGENIGLVSDSGTPGISDAGFLLVRECVKEDIPFTCLPGATAFVPAVIASGFPSNEFLFAGFLPQKKGRQTKLKELLLLNCTIVLYESPHRLLKLLQEIKTHDSNRRINVSRELTKVHEETKRGTAQELIEYFSRKEVKGEIVVVVNENSF